MNVWRHARPAGVEGRCIGVLDVAVDRRKTKRLAHRIRAWARRHGAPRHVVTSPLRRCAAVGRQLRAWGWTHAVDARLRELDFGAWEGRRWDAIAEPDITAWTLDFATACPGGGESVGSLLERCAAYVADPASRGACLVAHAGWIGAAQWLADAAGAAPTAASWPRAIGYGRRADLRGAAPRGTSESPPLTRGDDRPSSPASRRWQQPAPAA